jgi:hypothetical protein
MSYSFQIVTRLIGKASKVVFDDTAFSKSGYSVQVAEKLVGIAEDHGLHQMVREPTRVTSTSSNILDLAFINNPNMADNIAVMDGISDHDVVEVDLSFAPQIKRRVRRKVFLRDKVNVEVIQDDLLKFATEYNKDSVTKSTEEKWKAISGVIKQTMETNVPQKLTSARHDVPWFTNELRRLIKKKRRYYNKHRRTKSPIDLEKYRKIRNLTSTKLRQAKAKYYGEHLGESLEANPKAFWSYIKSLKSEDMGIADLKNKDGITILVITKRKLNSKIASL